MTVSLALKYSDLSVKHEDNNTTKRVRHAMAVPSFTCAAVGDCGLAMIYALSNLLTAGTLPALSKKTSIVCNTARNSLGIVFIRALSIINPNMHLSSRLIAFETGNGFIHAHTTLRIFKVRDSTKQSNQFHKQVTSRALALFCLALSPITRAADLALALPAMLTSLITRGNKPVPVILAYRALHAPGIIQDINQFGTAVLNHRA